MISDVADRLDEVVAIIASIGLAEAPREACGLIVPAADAPTSEWVVKFDNTSDDPEKSFRMEADAIIRYATAIDAEAPHRRSWERVVIWHTHPGGNVGPSPGDLANRLPGLQHMVVSLPEGIATRY